MRAALSFVLATALLTTPLKLVLALGVVQGLRDDLKAGYIRTLTEIIHGELFADFLEMAEHLLSGGYKDAAAVITGSTLEGHLKELAKKLSVPLAKRAPNGSDRPKTAERVNADLKKADAYGALDQRGASI